MTEHIPPQASWPLCEDFVIIGEMHITVKNLFKTTLVIFILSLLILTSLGLAKSYLSANRITHECKPTYQTKIDVMLDTPEYQQGFCQQYYYAEFKNSWNRTINNIAVPLSLFSGLALIPMGSILLFRKLSSKEK